MFLNYKNNALSWHLHNVCGKIKREEKNHDGTFFGHFSRYVILEFKPLDYIKQINNKEHKTFKTAVDVRYLYYQNILFL